MTHEQALAVAAAAMLRTLPRENRGAVLDGMIASHRATLARVRRDLLPFEIERRSRAYEAAVLAAIGNG